MTQKEKIELLIAILNICNQVIDNPNSYTESNKALEPAFKLQAECVERLFGHVIDM